MSIRRFLLLPTFLLIFSSGSLLAQFIDFTPAHVPHNSPVNYSQYWSITSYFLQLRDAPDWAYGEDIVTDTLYRPYPSDPGYTLECDPIATAHSLYLSRALNGSLVTLLNQFTATVNGDPGGLELGTFGRLRVHNQFDLFFHVGPLWTPPGETTPRPFISVVIIDPFDAYMLIESLLGFYPATIARQGNTHWVNLMNFARDHGACVMPISHVHPDHFTHPLFYEGVFQAQATALYGPGYLPDILVSDDIAVHLVPYQQAGLTLNPNVVRLTEASPFLRPVPGTTEALSVDRVTTYQDVNANNTFDPPATSAYHVLGWGQGPLVQTANPPIYGADPSHNAFKISFPGGPTMISMGEGTYLDLAAFQSYFSARPDYVLGRGGNTHPDVIDWLADTANGGTDSAAFIPTGYHNFHLSVGWVPYPADNPLVTLPGFIHYFEGGIQ